MTNQVQTVRTIVPPGEAMKALWFAHQAVVGGPTETALLSVLAAQSAFETARWHSMWNHNFGNVSGAYRGDWMLIPGAGEIEDGKPVLRGRTEKDGFRAYPSLLEGATDFVRFFCEDTNHDGVNIYDDAIRAAKVGNVTGFCAGLKAARYFTDGLEHYTRSVHDSYAWIQRAVLPEFLDSLVSEPHPLPPEAA